MKNIVTAVAVMMVSSFSRQISNVFTSNSIAMTSGTSGCAKHSIVKREAEAMYYAEANDQKLLDEVDEGKGEHVAAFARVLGCPSGQMDHAQSVLQRSYDRLFPVNNARPQDLVQGAMGSLIESGTCVGDRS